jgi:hypothetical protein
MDTHVTNPDIEKAAALALLDRGVAFRIPAPALLMLFGKKTISITVKRLYLGTLVHLSLLEKIAPFEPMKVPEDHEKTIDEMGAKPVSMPITDIVKNSKPVCRQVAACLLNSRLKIALFARILGRYLRRSCTADQIQELIMWLFVYGRPEAFTNTTKLLRKMTMTSPRIMGQKMKRS